MKSESVNRSPALLDVLGDCFAISHQIFEQLLKFSKLRKVKKVSYFNSKVRIIPFCLRDEKMVPSINIIRNYQAFSS